MPSAATAPPADACASYAYKKRGTLRRLCRTRRRRRRTASCRSRRAACLRWEGPSRCRREGRVKKERQRALFHSSTAHVGHTAPEHCLDISPMLQRRHGISTGLASEVSSSTTATQPQEQESNTASHSARSKAQAAQQSTAQPGEKAPQCKEPSAQRTSDQTKPPPGQSSRPAHITGPPQPHTRELAKPVEMSQTSGKG